MMVALPLNTRTDILVDRSSWRSFKRLPDNGLMRFSENIAAGASIAELAVLRIAESKDPKNNI